jgi:hypothetical protein
MDYLHLTKKRGWMKQISRDRTKILKDVCGQFSELLNGEKLMEDTPTSWMQVCNKGQLPRHWAAP